MVDKFNKIYKKLAVLLSIAMVVAMMPAMAMAEDELQDGVAKDTENREAAKQNVNPNQQVQGVYVSVMGVDGADILSGMFTELADNSTVYDVITYMFNAQMVPYDITPERINSIGGVGPNTTGGEKPAWFFAINSKLADKSVGQAKLKHGDILRVFYVKNADTARLGYIEPIGVAGDYFDKFILEEKNATSIYANEGDPIVLELMSTSLNFQNLSVQREENSVAKIDWQYNTDVPQGDIGVSIGKTYICPTFSYEPFVKMQK